MAKKQKTKPKKDQEEGNDKDKKIAALEAQVAELKKKCAEKGDKIKELEKKSTDTIDNKKIILSNIHTHTDFKELSPDTVEAFWNEDVKSGKVKNYESERDALIKKLVDEVNLMKQAKIDDLMHRLILESKDIKTPYTLADLNKRMEDWKKKKLDFVEQFSILLDDLSRSKPDIKDAFPDIENNFGLLSSIPAKKLKPVQDAYSIYQPPTQGGKS